MAETTQTKYRILVWRCWITKSFIIHPTTIYIIYLSILPAITKRSYKIQTIFVCEVGSWMNNGIGTRTMITTRKTGWIFRCSDPLPSPSRKPSPTKAAETVGWLEIVRAGVLMPGARLPGSESQLHHLLTVRPWASSLTSQGFNLFICKMVVTRTRVSSQRVLWGLNNQRWVKCLEQCLALGMFY